MAGTARQCVLRHKGTEDQHFADVDTVWRSFIGQLQGTTVVLL